MVLGAMMEGLRVECNLCGMVGDLCGHECNPAKTIAKLRSRLAAFESAFDQWMVINWIGVYDRERGVDETVKACLEKALDVERDELRVDAERFRAIDRLKLDLHFVSGLPVVWAWSASPAKEFRRETLAEVVDEAVRRLEG